MSLPAHTDTDRPSTGPTVPRIALSMGDPAGIGPEIVAAALRDSRVLTRARVVVCGPGSERPAGFEPDQPDQKGPGAEWVDTGGPERFELGRVQASCGRAALQALRAGAAMASEGRVDALVTGPVSKEALSLAGESVEGQTELLQRWAGVRRCQMVAVAGRLRVGLCTRHMPLSRALTELRTERVLDELRLLAEGLVALVGPRPRIALAGLNPHAGEGGLLGSEEEEILAPAVLGARAEGLNVRGPLSPDSVFLRASRGEFDGVLALYHDQAFIPIKLLGGESAFTVLVGLPYLRLSPIHGTAFDLAGTGRASPENLIACLLRAADWVSRRAAPTSPHGQPQLQDG